MFKVGKKYRVSGYGFTPPWTCRAVYEDCAWLDPMGKDASHGLIYQWNDKVWEEVKEPITTVAYTNLWERRDSKRVYGAIRDSKEDAEACGKKGPHNWKHIAIVEIKHVG